MRLIDAEKINFDNLKDPFEKARAEIIILGQPTICQGNMSFSNRIILSKCFEEWANKNKVLNSAESFIAWLLDMGFLYVDKANEYATDNRDILNKE